MTMALNAELKFMQMLGAGAPQARGMGDDGSQAEAPHDADIAS